MLNSPDSMTASVTRHGFSRQALRVESFGKSGLASREFQNAPRSHPGEADPPRAGSDTIWSALFWSALEGFALYGASLHGIVTLGDMPKTGETGAEPPQTLSWRERRKSIALVPSPANAQATPLKSENTIDRTAVRSQLPGARDHHVILAPDRPGRWRGAWRGIANRWAKWRREREISEAVEALRQFDDRTLRDMGIPHRSLIEQTVRYGRDC